MDSLSEVEIDFRIEETFIVPFVHPRHIVEIYNSLIESVNLRHAR
jgi:hypothetical protein